MSEMSDIDSISVQNVSKRYRLPKQSDRSKPKRLISWEFFRRQTFWALKGVNFDVRIGETLGIIGPNGSGKTTLIRLLSSITTPTKGEIRLRGRLASLVAIGAGFHPDLTGRENIYLNGSILGMRVAEITRKLDSIIDFSGLGDFINVPVKKYSSGMFVRLGFSIAAHLDAEIILLDEVLAVGDVAFQAKCHDKLNELRKLGKTVVLVSHDLAAVERLCDRALLLRSGEVVRAGDPRAIVELHQALAHAALAEPDLSKLAAGPVTLRGITFCNPLGGAARTGAPLICRIRYRAGDALSGLTCTLSLIWPSGYLCTQLRSAAMQVPAGDGEIEFTCPTLIMQRGLYTVDVLFQQSTRILTEYLRCSSLRVDLGEIVAGDFYMPHTGLLRPSQADNDRFIAPI